jgi:hypothetical protein
MKTPLVSVAWVVLGTVIGSFGAVFLKIGAGHLSRNLKSLLSNWRLALGIGLYLLSSVFYVIGVRNGELSVLYPMVSLGSVWTLLRWHRPSNSGRVFKVVTTWQLVAWSPKSAQI